MLNEETAAAADVLRTLTGPIQISQEPHPQKKRGAPWIAEFRPNLGRLLARWAGERDCPDRTTLEYLNDAIWTSPAPVTVSLEFTPKHEKLAPAVAELASKGASVNKIAQALGISWDLARSTLRYVRTGARPKTKPPGRRRPGGTAKAEPKYIKLAAEIARLRDEEGMTFAKIGRVLGMHKSTVSRAYWYRHRDALKTKLGKGEKPEPTAYSHIGLAAVQEIRELVDAGVKADEIARQVRCGKSTVYRVLAAARHGRSDSMKNPNLRRRRNAVN